MLGWLLLEPITPQFYVLPIDVVHKVHDAKGVLKRVMLSRIPNVHQYPNNWVLIRHAAVELARPGDHELA